MALNAVEPHHVFEYLTRKGNVQANRDKALLSATYSHTRRIGAFKGEDVKRAMAGGQLPGTDYERSKAYTNYIRRLQSGQSGFTCFASLQMPRG